MMSQAYFNMAKIGSGSQPSITWNDQAGMWNVISAFGKSVMDNCTFDGIISTGVMLQNLRSSSIDNHMNLTRLANDFAWLMTRTPTQRDQYNYCYFFHIFID
jgi:hypothetical protein